MTDMTPSLTTRIFRSPGRFPEQTSLARMHNRETRVRVPGADGVNDDAGFDGTGAKRIGTESLTRPYSGFVPYKILYLNVD